jgi:exonuclease VII small subunit
MSSERAHLIERYESIRVRFNEHIDRLEALPLEQKFDIAVNDYGAADIRLSHPSQLHKSLANDIASFWADMVATNDKPRHRTGHGIESFEAAMPRLRKYVQSTLDSARLGKTAA